nr:ADP-ribosyltransferase domain [Cedratvirus borely]
MDTSYILSLPPNIIRSLQDYTGSDYEEINRKMRLGQSLKGREKIIFNDLDLAFRAAPELQEPLYLYRGLTREPNFAYTSFISTTLDPDIALSSEFSSQRRLLKILVPTGSRVLPLYVISESPHEKEVLLSQRGRLSLTRNYVDKDRINVYECVYVPEVLFYNQGEAKVNKVVETKPAQLELDDEAWAERLSSLVSPEELEIFTPKETIELLLESFPEENISNKAVELAILKLSR